MSGGNGKDSPVPLAYNLDALRTQLPVLQKQLEVLQAAVEAKRDQISEYKLLIVQHEQNLQAHQEASRK